MSERQYWGRAMVDRKCLEVCVDSLAGLNAAIAGGADRIELCSSLALGGLTPSAGFMAQAGACPVPVNALIRPRSGDFVYNAKEQEIMISDIEAAREAGLAGVVIGASGKDHRLDRECLEELVKAAEGLDLTLHRAFDLVPDFTEALEQAIALGFSRILTSGGAKTAAQGWQTIAMLTEQARGRIAIMPGSGVKLENVDQFLALPDITQLHASCSAPHAIREAKLTELGFVEAQLHLTDEALVRALKARITR